MNDLSKQQLILLALLVSFVTSLSTGVVTVSLMNQAPESVTRTVSQVIEKTIQQVVPQSASVIQASSGSDAASAISDVSKSLVAIRDASSGAFLGDGLIISPSGAVATDKSIIAQGTSYEAVLPGGTILPMSLSLSQDSGDIAILVPSVKTVPVIQFSPVTAASGASLGQPVISLYATASSTILGQGVIDSSGPASTTMAFDASSTSVEASIGPARAPIGSVLFALDGSVIGLRTSSGGSDASQSTVFYPLYGIMPVVQAQ